MTISAFVPQPTVLRTHALFTVTQEGGSLGINGKTASGGGTPILVDEVAGNPHHFLRPHLAEFRARNFVAVVCGAHIDGKSPTIGLTAEEWALGAGERARYAAWVAECVTAKRALQEQERAFDLGYNEGNEGFNPHRVGDTPTYRRYRRG